MIKRKIYFAAILMLMAMFSAGCSDETHFHMSSPEDLAIHFVQENREDDFTIEDNSVTVIQTIEENGNAFILVQYDGERTEVGTEKCEVVLEAQHDPVTGWSVQNGSGLCHESDDSSKSVPLTIASSQGSFSRFGGRYSTVFGYVRDSRIIKVFVTWDDGQEQSVGVNMSTYFIVREGESQMIRIAAYNEQNKIVFEENLALDSKDGN